MARTSWIDVDLDGLRKTLSRKGVAWVVRELLQNAFDELVQTVGVALTAPARAASGTYHLEVWDDCPTGFTKLSEAWTLFGESKKKADPEKAGRFLAGEKFVLAMCEWARIESTTGTVFFSAGGRKHYADRRRDVGTRFTCELRLTADEAEELRQAVREALPPAGVRLLLDGEPLPRREQVTAFTAPLQTEVADEAGVLRRRTRDAVVVVYEPQDGQPGRLYELGTPVCETGDRWDVDVRQKVPLTLERDGVPPAWMQRLRGTMLNHTHHLLTREDVLQPWVRDGAGSEVVDKQAVERVTTLRFGDKAVAFDPSDPEANKLAVSAGYTVVHGGSMTSHEWSNVREAGMLPRAGVITPSPKPFAPDGRALVEIELKDWQKPWLEFGMLARRLAAELLNVTDMRIVMANDRGWGHRAAWSRGAYPVLYWNVATGGKAFYDDGPTEKVLSLLLHEFGHQYCGDHLSADYYRALTDLGARLALLAVRDPDLLRQAEKV